MPTYDLRCSACDRVEERKFAYIEADHQYCNCGGKHEIIVTQVNISSDAMPTRGWGKFTNAPKPVRPDGSAINPGHEPITAASLRLTHDQAARLDLK